MYVVNRILSGVLITERYILLQCNWVDRMGWKGINQNSNTTFRFFLSLYEFFATEELWNQRQLCRLIIWTGATGYRVEGWGKLPFPLPCTAKASVPIHVFESDLYNPTIGLPILLQENRWTNRGNIHAVSFLGVHESDIFAVCPLLVPLQTTTFTKVAFVRKS
jgi:hypothetical protein